MTYATKQILTNDTAPKPKHTVKSKDLFSLAVFAILVVCTSCATRKLEVGRSLEASAHTFMAGYAADLVAQNREAILARYHPQGV